MGKADMGGLGLLLCKVSRDAYSANRKSLL
jgi:hypothetical protein